MVINVDIKLTIDNITIQLLKSNNNVKLDLESKGSSLGID